MAADRLRLPPSPGKRTPSPATRINFVPPEERRQEGYEILRKIQAVNVSSFLTGRPATSYPISATKKPEDTKTVKGKVRTADSISGKGLLAADLIKNLQYQQASTVNNASQRAISARLRRESGHLDAIQIERPNSEITTHRLAPISSDMVRRSSLPAPTLKQKSRAAKDILRKYSSAGKLEEDGTSENVKNEIGLPPVTKFPSASQLSRVHRKSVEEVRNDERVSKTIPKETSAPSQRQRKVSLIVPDEKRNEQQRPSKEKVGQRSGDEKVQSSKGKGQNTNGFHGKKKEVKVLEKKSIAWDDNGSENERIKKKKKDKSINVSKKGAKLPAKKESEDSGTSSDSESDSENEKRKKRASKKMRMKENGKQKSKKEKRESQRRRVDSSEDTSDDGSCDEGKEKMKAPSYNESDKDNDKDNDNDSDNDNEINTDDNSEKSETSDDSASDSEDEDEKTRRKEDVRKKANGAAVKDNFDPISEDETNENAYDNLIVEEELAEFSKQITAPGMPAMDLLETHEKFLKDGLYRDQRENTSEVSKEDKSGNSDYSDRSDGSDDEIEDLIDHIDGLIDADDEDITFANKEKKKSLQSQVNKMMLAKKLTNKNK